MTPKHVWVLLGINRLIVKLKRRIRAKLDSYSGGIRTNVSVVDARPASHAEHGYPRDAEPGCAVGGLSRLISLA